jgi:hypothetical protein
MDRTVTAALVVKPVESREKQIYGIYAMVPSKRAIVVKADLPLLANLAAVLLGLPAEAAVERAQETPMNESVRDAIHEILNISSTALSSESRVVFDKMVTDPVFCEGEAVEVIQSPDLTTTFQVTIAGKVAGSLRVLSRF